MAHKCCKKYSEYTHSKAFKHECMARQYLKMGQTHYPTKELLETLQPYMQTELKKQQRARDILRTKSRQQIEQWLSTLPTVFEREWRTRFNTIIEQRKAR